MIIAPVGGARGKGLLDCHRFFWEPPRRWLGTFRYVLALYVEISFPVSFLRQRLCLPQRACEGQRAARELELKVSGSAPVPHAFLTTKPRSHAPCQMGQLDHFKCVVQCR